MSNSAKYGVASTGNITITDMNGSVYKWDEVNTIASVIPNQHDFDAFEKKMEKRMSAIEDQVLIVRRDQILEKDYKELEEAWKAYNDLMEKLKTFNRLKDSA